MTIASVSEVKAHLSAYLREVKRGGSVEIRERGVPVARLVAVGAAGPSDSGTRDRLLRDGLLRAGDGEFGRVLDRPPVQLGDADLVAAVRQDREDGE